MDLIENALNKLRRGATEPAGLVKRSPSSRIAEFNAPALRAMGYLPESGLELEFAEYYREIKRPVVRRALAANAPAMQRQILVTSALPGEGKTFTTLNLALSMARERDVSLLLVDADFPKAHISRALGVNEEPGLLDAVANELLDVDSMVMRTNVKGLDFLPSGQYFDGAAELVASARMTEIAMRLVASNPRRLVLFDSPPLLVSSEARALIQMPGQIIFVCRVGRTPRRALQDAIAQIDSKKLHGLVLNDAYVNPKNNYYGYAQQYGDRSEKTEGTK